MGIWTDYPLKTNPEDDSLESSSNTKKQRKKGQK